MVSFFRWGRSTTRPERASEVVGVEYSSAIVSRRGTHSKRSRIWVTKLCPRGQGLSLTVVRFNRMFRGRGVMTPPRLNLRKG